VVIVDCFGVVVGEFWRWTSFVTPAAALIVFLFGRHHPLWRWWSVAWRLLDLGARDGRFILTTLLVVMSWRW
jgi:hypothetical protein